MVKGKTTVTGTIDTLSFLKIRRLIEEKKYKGLSQVLNLAIKKFLEDEEGKDLLNKFGV